MVCIVGTTGPDRCRKGVVVWNFDLGKVLFKSIEFENLESRERVAPEVQKLSIGFSVARIETIVGNIQ